MTQAEVFASAVCVWAAIALFTFAPLGGIVTMLAIAIAMKAVSLLLSPAMALLADEGLRDAADLDQHQIAREVAAATPRA